MSTYNGQRIRKAQVKAIGYITRIENGNYILTSKDHIIIHARTIYHLGRFFAKGFNDITQTIDPDIRYTNKITAEDRVAFIEGFRQGYIAEPTLNKQLKCDEPEPYIPFRATIVSNSEQSTSIASLEERVIEEQNTNYTQTTPVMPDPTTQTTTSITPKKSKLPAGYSALNLHGTTPKQTTEQKSIDPSNASIALTDSERSKYNRPEKKGPWTQSA